MNVMKTILYIAPAVSVKGGISSVVKGYVGTFLSLKYRILMVSSHVDGNRTIKTVAALSGLLNVIKLLVQYRIDIVHIHGSDIVSSSRKLLFFTLARTFRCKTIYHFHGASFSEQFSKAPPVLKKAIAGMFTRADLVICLSGSWRREILSIAPRANIKVIPNAVNLPQQGGPRSPGSRATLVFLGLIGARKGVFDLVRVVGRLADDACDLRLYIGGNGDTAALVSLIGSLGLGDRVEFLGWIDERERDALLRKADIFVLPSYAEGMPMSIVEAMSYGLPVVSTDVGGIPELVKDGETGFILKPGDLDALYEKLRLLIGRDDLRREYGASGRRFVEQHHNLQRNAEMMDEIYRSL